MESAWQYVLAWVAEHGAYFLTLSSNTPVALTWFSAGLLVWLLWRGYWARRLIDKARRALPLTVGGWGSRGKSGTERLKAGLFHGLGFEVFTKTTGCEAMFIHSVPGLSPLEVFLYRSYDKATIWEQSDAVQLAAKLDTQVFTWECMALNPRYARHLQHEWMRDDVVTLTNAYPDHEDVQGPAGIDVARVIGEFVPRDGRLFTTEQNFRPLFSDLARDRKTSFLPVAIDNADLLPDDVLARFPYREHPRNIALIQSVAVDLGVDPLLALYQMADNVVPDLGVLREYPEITVCGRQIAFVNGMSANERAGFMSNWKSVGFAEAGEQVTPGKLTATVVNNREDRPARSKVFARLLVEDAHADRHFVIGTAVGAFYDEVGGAAERYLADVSVAGAEDPAGRLDQLMSRQQLPKPDADTLLRHLDVMLTGIGCTLDSTHRGRIGVALSGFLDANWGRLPELDSLRQTALEQPWLTGLDNAVVQAPPVDVLELLQPGTVEDVKAAFARLLARTAYRAELERTLARSPAGFDETFRTAYRRLLLDQIVVVGDPRITGDQLIELIARHLPPGVQARVMGVQNIKGTGLDFCYRWVSLDNTYKNVVALQIAGRRTGALRALDFMDGGGYFDVALAHAVVSAVAASFSGLDRTLADKLIRRLDPQRKQLRKRLREGEGARGKLARLLDGVERLVDWMDEIQRRRMSRRVLRDLGNRRISHARAATEIQALVKRSKGGWLAGSLIKKTEEADVRPPLETPAPLPVPKPVENPTWSLDAVPTLNPARPKFVERESA